MEKHSENNLKVIARFRPLIDIELQLPENKECELKFVNESTVALPNSLNDLEYFNFDRVFPSSCSQAEIFEFVGVPIIEDVLTGYNGTVFAYGQTGSGKTFTMMGADVHDLQASGVIPRSLRLIFQTLANDSSENEFTVKCSMLEIYKETLKDLLGNRGELKIKQDKRKGIYVEGLTEVYVVCEEETLDVLAMGESNRTVACTKMNSVSSRSHQLFMVEILQKFPNGSEKRGRLNLVDLAGSEKINQTGVSGNKLEEAKKINLSLSALGNVIKALTDKAEHIPYRDSKLTRLLQESLGGNFKTTLIVNCSPHPRNVEDSINTLKFAQRAKSIKNKAIVNIKQSAEAYIKIIQELQKKLAVITKELETYKAEKPTSPIMFMRNDEKSPSELSLESKFSELKLEDNKIEEKLKLDDLYEKVNSLRQDQEFHVNKIRELELEVDRERKKRIKTEKEIFELTQKYAGLVNSQMKFEQSENFQVEQNKSLARQVEILKFHLERMNLKFAEDLKKLEQGEKVREWEFIDMAKMRVDQNADLPVYTEEESLEVVNTSEYNIDIPVQESILLKNDRYAVHLCQKIENPSQVNKDLLLFELKKQVIQSNMVNCELGRSYFELLWKYKLLREKMNLRSKVIRSQKQRIITLESLVTSLNLSYSKLVEILEKLETKPIENHQESPFKRKMVRCVKPMCTIAPIRDNPLQDLQGLQSFQAFQALHGAQGPQAGIIKRQKSRRETVASNINLQSFRNSFQMSGANLNETYNKYLFLESNFQNQLMFNDSLKRSNEVITIERNSYKKLLDEFTRENHVIYLNEKNRWKGFLDDFKAVCETELVRKQVEINKLNQILANWMNRYMELEESVKGARVLNSAHKEQIQDLLGQTRIQVRPTKLQIFESPLHCRFKSMASTHVSNIDGDISPPSFE